MVKADLYVSFNTPQIIWVQSKTNKKWHGSGGGCHTPLLKRPKNAVNLLESKKNFSEKK